MRTFTMRVTPKFRASETSNAPPRACRIDFETRET